MYKFSHCWKLFFSFFLLCQPFLFFFLVIPEKGEKNLLYSNKNLDKIVPKSYTINL